jgi:integrase
MANLGKKGVVYVARFRFGGKEYKKSLKTDRLADARAALKGVERVIHGLTTGLVQVPAGVDPGDYIVSGGTLREPPRPRRRGPPLSALIDEYLANLAHKAPTSVYTEGVHLRNLRRKLGPRAEAPADRTGHRDLELYLQSRLRERTASTVHKERDTIISSFKWAVSHGHLDASPAVGLTPIKVEVELPRFRTIAEIEEILSRGGLSEAEVDGAWDCLYLNPAEIGGLLRTVRERADADFGYLLHAVPAYTGMRRGEVLRLRWQDVEFDRGQIVARSRKQSRRVAETARRIDLHPELGRELQAWRDRRPGGQHVFCEPGSTEPLDPDRANRAFWQPMRRTAWCLKSKRNWFKIGFHTYHHSFASNLAARGVDQRIIDEWMGHQTEAMRKRYRHLFPKDRRSAIASFSFAPPPPFTAGGSPGGQ